MLPVGLVSCWESEGLIMSHLLVMSPFPEIGLTIVSTTSLLVFYLIPLRIG